MADMTIPGLEIEGETHDADAFRLVIDVNPDGTFQDAEILANLTFLKKPIPLLSKFSLTDMQTAFGNIDPAPSMTLNQLFQAVKSLMIELVKLKHGTP